MPERADSNRRTIAIVATAVIALGAGVWWLRRSSSGRDTGAPTASTGASATASGTRGHPSSPANDTSRIPSSAPPDLAVSVSPGASRKERAKATLAAYVDWSRYPPGSRPARERPDRRRPHAAPTRKLPLSRPDKRPSDVSLVLAQSHYFLTGDETATLTLSCRRGDEPLPCTVTSASAEAGPGATGGPAAPVAVPFADGGVAPDAASNDGVWTASLTPSKLGLENLFGPLSITATVSADGETGTGNFQLALTPKPPATFTGTLRESLDHGSLSLCVELLVAEPGRYVLDARVDDESSEPFAFLSWNDLLAAGKQEACFTLFGRLVLDEHASAPFHVRDVEGFLLLEDAFPDRKSIPTLEGLAHTTKRYVPNDFSTAEWQSPVKDRYLERLQRDVDSAD